MDPDPFVRRVRMQASESGGQTLLVDNPTPQRAELVEKLEATRQDMRRYLLVRCLLQVTILGLAGLSLLGFADWMWTLSPTVRGDGLLLLGVAALVLIIRLAIAPRRRFGHQDAACEIESAFPDLGQRVRTSLEYVEPTRTTAPVLPELVEALADETQERTRGLNLKRIIPWVSLWRSGVVAGAVLSALLFLLAEYPELRITALRLFLIPSQYTTLAVQPGDVTVKQNEDVTIEATLTGRPVPAADLVYRQVGSNDEWTRLSFNPEATSTKGLLGTLQTQLSDCRQDLEYRIAAGPVESRLYRVTVLHSLAIKKLEATIEAPAYTRRPPVQANEGNFQVIAGSKVQFRILLDRMPQAAELRLAGSGAKKESSRSLPSQPLRINNNELVGELASVDRELEYEVFAEAADGMRLDSGKFRIRVLPDHKPVVRL
jgi:hypothetical protein